MPHSSGGGSHGGGFHSGGSFHSSSSHGSGGRSGPSTSRHYFPGAYRYVYYSHSRPVYFYGTGAVKKGNWKSVCITNAAFILIWFLFGWAIFGDSFSAPSRLSMDYEDTRILIGDDASLLSDEECDEIYDVFLEFQQKSGITPAFRTVYNEEWKGNYSSLENYAYDMYVNAFEDESHWLLVYSEPENANGAFDDWYWEGMQGDDTDSIITQNLADTQGQAFQKYLTKESCSVGEALEKSFQEILPGLMDKKYVDPEDVMLFVLFVILPCLFFAYRAISAFLTRGREGAIRCKTAKEKPLEDKCEYCGGIYVHGLHESCPHCGAPIKAAE